MKVTVHVDGTGTLKGLRESKKKLRQGLVSDLAGVPQGMSSGRASVAIVGKLRDGSAAFLEMGMQTLLQAAEAFKARYGIEADGASPAQHSELTRERMNAAVMLLLLRSQEGQEVTFNVDEINALMQSEHNFELQHHEDGKHITVRACLSE